MEPIRTPIRIDITIITCTISHSYKTSSLRSRVVSSTYKAIIGMTYIMPNSINTLCCFRDRKSVCNKVRIAS